MFAFLLFENYIQVPFFCPLSLLLLFAQEEVERGTEGQCPCSSSPRIASEQHHAHIPSPSGSVSVWGRTPVSSMGSSPRLELKRLIVKYGNSQRLLLCSTDSGQQL